ncbi:MAG TPA: sensor histidine kinase [Mucilaginibacter sp.]|jgi:uncharacterized membrane protein YwzB
MLALRKKHLAEIVIHVLFWIGVFYAIDSLTGSSVKMRLSHNGVITEIHENQTLFPFSFITLGLLMLLFYTNIFWLYKSVLRFPKSISRIAIVAGWFALIFFANYFLLGALMERPKPAFPHLQPRGAANLFYSKGDHLQVIIALIFLCVLGLSIAYFFLQEWGRNELLRKQMEASQMSTEIKFLKSQINPHFLFNTLNNLFSMAQHKGNDDLADGISKLSGMMRYMIYDSNAESVPLSKEIAYLEDCITLNKLRYADNEVKVRFDYPAHPGKATIAPMLFIPFVENAFKHGVMINQPSQIDMAIVVSGKQVLFTCENKNYSFVKKMNDQTSGIGLENVKRRLELVYPGKYELDIKNNEDKYTVMLKINWG